RSACWPTPTGVARARATAATRGPKHSIRRVAWRAAASRSPESSGGAVTATGPSSRTMSGKSIVASQFERAANLINLEQYMRHVLLHPFREVQVGVPIRIGDRCIRDLIGYA